MIPKVRLLEIAERIDFSILPLTPHKVLPLYEAHTITSTGEPQYRTTGFPTNQTPTQLRRHVSDRSFTRAG